MGEPLLVVSADVEGLAEGRLAYDPPCFIMNALNVLLYVCCLNFGVIGDKFAEFRLELWRLMEVPRDGGIEEGLHLQSRGRSVSRPTKHSGNWYFSLI